SPPCSAPERRRRFRRLRPARGTGALPARGNRVQAPRADRRSPAGRSHTAPTTSASCRPTSRKWTPSELHADAGGSVGGGGWISWAAASGSVGGAGGSVGGGGGWISWPPLDRRARGGSGSRRRV